MTEDELNRCLEHMHYAFRNLVREPDRILAKYDLGRAHNRALYFIAKRSPSIGEAAKLRNEDPNDTVLNLLSEENGRVGMVFFTMKEDDEGQRPENCAVSRMGTGAKWRGVC